MDLLQTVTDFGNKEQGLPAQISKCALMSDSENVRILLRLSLKKFESVKAVYTDVCCYGKDGLLLSVMERVPYIDGGMLIELPSLMTASVCVILREATLSDGASWTSDTEIPKQITVTDDFEKTAKFDPVEVAAPPEEPEKSKRSKRRELKKARAAEEEELRQMIKTDPKERKKRIIARLLTVVILAGLLFGGFKLLVYKDEADTTRKKALNLYNSGKFEDAIPELEKANGYFMFGGDSSELEWALAMSYARQRDFFDAAVYFKNQIGYKESNANYRSIAEAYSGIISAGSNHSVGLKTDGTVIAAGNNDKEQCEVGEWLDIIKVSAGGDHSVGLTRGKTVVAAGDNDKGQCEVDDWKSIIDISAGGLHTVGVENIGSVIATGDNTYGQCEVDDWSGIVSVSAGDNHTVGLKIDGTVVAAGDNSLEQCEVSGWSGVMQIAAGSGFTAGLKYDGTVLITGSVEPVRGLKDILFISAGSHNLLLTTTKGQVVTVGGSSQITTEHWKMVVAAAGGGQHSVGVSADGTAFGTGDNTYGQTSLDNWSGIGIPKQTVKINSGNIE